MKRCVEQPPHFIDTAVKFRVCVKLEVRLTSFSERRCEINCV